MYSTLCNLIKNCRAVSSSYPVRVGTIAGNNFAHRRMRTTSYVYYMYNLLAKLKVMPWRTRQNCQKFDGRVGQNDVAMTRVLTALAEHEVQLQELQAQLAAQRDVISEQQHDNVALRDKVEQLEEDNEVLRVKVAQLEDRITTTKFTEELNGT